MHDKVRQEIAAKGFARSRIVILDALLKLRQVCCDPRLVKLAAARKVGASAKLDHLMQIVPSLIEEGRRILLFSQFTSMLDLIEPELERAGIDFVEIRGDTRDRAAPVRRFQSGKVPLFLISLRAGGTGLNLTAADTVIHYDPWWNPAVEDQATDRAHRIGQDKAVFVYKLVARGTVEERMLELQERKRALAAGIYGDRRMRGRHSTPPISNACSSRWVSAVYAVLRPRKRSIGSKSRSECSSAWPRSMQNVPMITSIVLRIVNRPGGADCR